MALSALVLASLQSLAAELRSGYYLKWDSDHTERTIRPVYPISAEDAARFNAYHIEFIDEKPQRVCFFTSLKASERSDYGAHCIKFSYGADAVDKTFFNAAGERVADSQGVFRVRYLLDGQQFATKKQNLNQSNQLMQDASGSAEYHFKRDTQGRRTREIRKDVQGNVVLEHNGFYEARFEFDENDYATVRRGFDQNGRPMEGKYGYVSAHFWFDKYGNFEKEEFRNVLGDLVSGPSRRFARIEYRNIDAYGNWHEVRLYDSQAALLRDAPAILVAKYHDNATRASVSYFDRSGAPAENDRGVSRYNYLYDESGAYVERLGYSLAGELVRER